MVSESIILIVADSITHDFVFSLENNVGDHLFLRNMFKSSIRDPLRMKKLVVVDSEGCMVGPSGSPSICSM